MPMSYEPCLMCYKEYINMNSYSSTGHDWLGWFVWNHFLFFVYARCSLGWRCLLLNLLRSHSILCYRMVIRIWINMFLMNNDIRVDIGAWYNTLRHCILVLIHSSLIHSITWMGCISGISIVRNIVSVPCKRVVMNISYIKWILSQKLRLIIYYIRLVLIRMFMRSWVVRLVILH